MPENNKLSVAAFAMLKNGRNTKGSFLLEVSLADLLIKGNLVLIPLEKPYPNKDYSYRFKVMRKDSFLSKHEKFILNILSEKSLSIPSFLQLFLRKSGGLDNLERLVLEELGQNKLTGFFFFLNKKGKKEKVKFEDFLRKISDHLHSRPEEPVIRNILRSIQGLVYLLPEQDKELFRPYLPPLPAIGKVMIRVMDEATPMDDYLSDK